MQACSLKPSVQLFSSKASGLQRGTAVAAVQRLAAPAARSTQLVVEGKRGMLAPQWPTPAGRWPRAWVLGGALCEWKLLAGRPRGWSGWSRQLGRRRRSPHRPASAAPRPRVPLPLLHWAHGASLWACRAPRPTRLPSLPPLLPAHCRVCPARPLPAAASRVCDLTGKRANNGYVVTFSHKRNKKLQQPNLQYKKVYWPEGQR